MNNLLSYILLSSLSFFLTKDLQLKPYRTDEFIHKLFYETSRFSALSYQWVIKARLNDNQKDPHLTCNRFITYQVSNFTFPLCSRLFILTCILPLHSIYASPSLVHIHHVCGWDLLTSR